jgi:galactonate dehydratase
MKAKVTRLETLSCDAGWRNYYYLKLTTDEGVVGWSEFDEGFGSPGVGAIIERLSPRVVGKRVDEHELIYTDLYAATRPGSGGVVSQAMGAIENALLDAKAKLLGVPCYVLLGGKIRDRVRVYWSHCATWRINYPAFFKPAITDLDGVRSIGREVRKKGFTALKTNLFLYEEGGKNPKGYRPSFGVPSYPELNFDRGMLRNLRMHLEALREGAGPDVDLLLDLNFHAKTEGCLKILREIADLDMFWIEIDSFNPEALGYIRRQSPHPISSCETMLGIREFLPYFREQAMDVAIIDAPWNGAWQAMKIAALAEAHEVNVASPQLLWAPLHHDQRALRGRRSQPSHHGDRHRSAAMGPRTGFARSRVRQRASDHSRSAWVGNGAKRGSHPRAAAERCGRSRAAARPRTIARMR